MKNFMRMDRRMMEYAGILYHRYKLLLLQFVVYTTPSKYRTPDEVAHFDYTYPKGRSRKTQGYPTACGGGYCIRGDCQNLRNK